jgi:hypothetical protein
LFEPADDITQALYEQVMTQKGCRPMYISSLNLRLSTGTAAGEFEIVPEANLFRLIPKQIPDTSKITDVAQSWSQAPLDELIRGPCEDNERPHISTYYLPSTGRLRQASSYGRDPERGGTWCGFRCTRLAQAHLLAPGETHTMAELQGPGIINACS